MTTGDEPTLSDVLQALGELRTDIESSLDGLRVAYREDLLALTNTVNRRFDRLQGEMERRFGVLMDAVADVRKDLTRHIENHA